MGWEIGYDKKWNRDIGYGVPVICDHPDCNKEIHRGLAYVCGGRPYGGEYGCGLFFCDSHLYLGLGHQVCERCRDDEKEFEPSPDIAEWNNHKLTHKSWQQWRDKNPEEVDKLKS
jgi:hypothetical protein